MSTILRKLHRHDLQDLWDTQSVTAKHYTSIHHCKVNYNDKEKKLNDC